jgi:phosphoribosylanthranilate isomerase
MMPDLFGAGPARPREAADTSAAAARTRVKICGLTRPADAERAAAAGADAIGVVFAASVRRITPAQAIHVFEAAPAGAARVGVFADQPLPVVIDIAAQCGLDWVQLCGDEPAAFAAALPLPVLRSVHVHAQHDIEAARGYPAAAFLLDAPRRRHLRGGTGTVFDWSLAAVLPWPRGRVVAAGGLDADNVGAAIAQLRPGAVDVASGVEAAPGIKDVGRLEAFIAAVRRADLVAHTTRAEAGGSSADHR